MAMKQHNGAYIAAYRDGFFDGASADKYPQTLSIMGYRLDQIIDAIHNRNEEPQGGKQEQMTREERVRQKMKENEAKGKSAMECEYGYCSVFVSGEMAVEEAMGMIKFKPEPEPEKPVFEAKSPFGHSFKIWADGRTEGFPEGYVTINRIPQLQLK